MGSQEVSGGISDGMAMLVLEILLPALSIVAVSLRFYARRRRKAPLLADDWLIFAALMCNLAINFANWWALLVNYQTIMLWPEPELPSVDTLLFATIIIQSFSYGLIKFSVILFFKRIFSVGVFVLWANVLLSLSVLWTLLATISMICTTVSGNTFFWSKQAHSWDALNLSIAASDLALDVAILLLPLISIRQMLVSRARKLYIFGLFSLGFVCCVSSAIRLYFCYEVMSFNYSHKTDLSDGFWNPWAMYVSSATFMWLLVEGNISVIAACMPIIGGFLRSTLKQMRQKNDDHANRGNQSEQKPRRVKEPGRKDSVVWLNVDWPSGLWPVTSSSSNAHAQPVKTKSTATGGGDGGGASSSSWVDEFPDSAIRVTTIRVTTEFGHFTTQA